MSTSNQSSDTAKSFVVYRCDICRVMVPWDKAYSQWYDPNQHGVVYSCAKENCRTMLYMNGYTLVARFRDNECVWVVDEEQKKEIYQ